MECVMVSSPDSGTASSEVAQYLKSLIPDIVERWAASVDRPPWSALSTSDRVDHLPPFLSRLFDWAVRDELAAGGAEAFLAAGAEHGTHRRRMHLSYDVVMEESALLRRAIWGADLAGITDRRTVVMVDSALTVGLLASLRGYAKPELVASGQWEGSLARLATEYTSSLSSRSRTSPRSPRGGPQ